MRSSLTRKSFLGRTKMSETDLVFLAEEHDQASRESKEEETQTMKVYESTDVQVNYEKIEETIQSSTEKIVKPLLADAEEKIIKFE